MYRPDKSFMRDPATVNSRIYVGSLDESVTPDKLEEHFKAHGNIRGVVVNRGFGFIQFEEDNSAQLAIQKEHGVMFMGRKLNVKQAIENKNKNVLTPSGPPGEELPGPGKPVGPSKPMDGGPPRKIRRGGGGQNRGGGAGGRGGAVMGMEKDHSPVGDDRDYSCYRDGPPFYERENFPSSGSGYVPPPAAERNHITPEKNDCEIIVVSKALTEYAEYIEHRLKSIGLTVDLLFPNEDVPIGRVLANISSRGCLYAILVMPQNEEHRSFTLNILHGIPQEHRNMPVDDAVGLISRNFDAYMRGEKSGPSTVAIGPAPITAERHPEAIQILLNLLADNRQLTTLQYDRIIKYLQERRELQYKQELGEAIDEKDHKKEAELQNRIMSILNKNPGAPSPSLAPSIVPQAAKNSAPILNDPSVQKALDSLLQGDILKSISSSGRF